MSINITGISKAKVLVALYNNAKGQGFGLQHFRSEPMSEEEASKLLQNETYFDYVHGRVLKVDLSEDTFDPWLYDRDNGHGAADRAIRSIQ